jgi:hypothetical protein
MLEPVAPRPPPTITLSKLAVHGAVAAVRQVAADLVGAGYLVVDLGDGGVHLKGGGDDLFGDALMEPEQLPPIHRPVVAGKLVQSLYFGKNADEIGRLFGRRQRRRSCLGLLCIGR